MCFNLSAEFIPSADKKENYPKRDSFLHLSFSKPLVFQYTELTCIDVVNCLFQLLPGIH